MQDHRDPRHDATSRQGFARTDQSVRPAAGQRASRYPARRVTDPQVRSPQLGMSDAEVVRELVALER